MLVYSKTALNPQLVSPETPRAVFFNENSYVGWVPGAAALEIAAVDPHKGLMFYTLNLPDFSKKETEAAAPQTRKPMPGLPRRAVGFANPGRFGAVVYHR